MRFTDLGATDLRVGVNGGPIEPVARIEILLGGDCEAECFVEALEFAVRVLRGQIGDPYTEEFSEEKE